MMNWCSIFRYVPPPPSRPRYNNDDIETNNIFSEKENKSGIKESNARGFFVDVPPKFYKASPAKQQYYQDQYLNDIFSKNYYNKANKYSIIAFKDKYRGLPYYVVSNLKKFVLPKKLTRKYQNRWRWCKIKFPYY